MKKGIACILALCIGLGAGLGIGAAVAKQGNVPVEEAAKGAGSAGNFTDEMKFDDGADISAEDGADSVERLTDHEDSPYFLHPDFYNMTSTDTLTILPQRMELWRGKRVDDIGVVWETRRLRRAGAGEAEATGNRAWRDQPEPDD